jgi:hypothetical protein
VPAVGRAEPLSDRWEREGQLERLIDDMCSLTSSLRIGAVELTGEQLATVLVAGAQVAGEAARQFEQVD